MLELIKFEHSVFALPFALSALLVASAGRPSGWVLGWVIVAMVAARSAAMAHNRLADEKLDAQNPRTRDRHLPRGLVSRGEVWALVVGASAVFVLACAMLNRLCLALSPVALAAVLLYSYTKRFTVLTHYLLGLCLAIAPVGAWIAATGAFALEPLVLAAGVVFWVAGFDIIYACQDYEFDRRAGLYSLPAALGIAPALWAARVGHALSVGFLFAFGALCGLGAAYAAGVALIGLLLLYEHTLVRADDLSRVNVAFFTVNGFISMLFLVATGADLLLGGAG